MRKIESSILDLIKDSVPCNEIMLNAKQALEFGLIDEIVPYMIPFYSEQRDYSKKGGMVYEK